MFTISHIVVAADLTARSAAALQQAARLKQELAADSSDLTRVTSGSRFWKARTMRPSLRRQLRSVQT
jgi:hypothetical protein